MTSASPPRAFIIAGAAFGDEGKGATVDFLARTHAAQLVVRHNGGPQAAHHVVTSDGRSHCFSQFGSGTLAGASTFLSRFMMISPINLLREATHLRELGISDPFSLLTIDPSSPVITPFHVHLNQLRELSRGLSRHGSCGQGIGELGADRSSGQELLTINELLNGNPSIVVNKIKRIQERLLLDACRIERSSEAMEDLYVRMKIFPHNWIMQSQDLHPLVRLSDRLPPSDVILFEGAQGILLDERFGFHPYTTWSDCTMKNALLLLSESGFSGVTTRIACLRTFLTRHGAGPLPTEDERLATLVSSDHNRPGPWQGSLRTAHFDLPLIDYAFSCLSPVDEISLSHADVFSSPWLVCTSHNGDSPPTFLPLQSLPTFIDLLESRYAPISILASGPTAAHRQFRLPHERLTSLESSSRSI